MIKSTRKEEIKKGTGYSARRNRCLKIKKPRRDEKKTPEEKIEHKKSDATKDHTCAPAAVLVLGGAPTMQATKEIIAYATEGGEAGESGALQQ